ncbi:MAG: tetratricopeptide repeat protein [Verrucomicrobiota bacterium]|jgi:tetratricopeptide (TPR) repeat protein
MIGQQSLAQVGAGCADQRWKAVAVCVLLAAMTFAVFGQTLTHGFVDIDDYTYVVKNPMVARGLTHDGIIWAFTHVHSSNWHPLTWLSHMLDCQLCGLHPGGHHLTSVLLHTASAILLFLVLRRMTEALWRSAFVAAMFAIHPLRVESVAWVAERKDVLSGLFFMLSIAAYVRYARLPWSFGRYGLVLLLFAMGLMCKPMLVTLPLVLLLLDYWPLQRMETRKLSRLVMEKLPLLALSAASCVVTLLAQNKALQSTESSSLPLRLANALTSCMVYLGQMIYPAGLAVFYPFPHHGLPEWKVALAGMLFAGITSAALWQRRKQPWLLMGWLWYLGMLLPVLGIVQVGDQSHADRYTYLPQIGLYVAVTWLVAEWCANRAMLGFLMTGVAGLLMVCAWKQTAYWKDNETLWTHALACTTGNSLAEYNLAYDFVEKGRLDEAIGHCQKALDINPDNPDAHNTLGVALVKKGRVDEAIGHYQVALRLEPSNAKVHFNYGEALEKREKWDEAISQYRLALQCNPDYMEAHLNLANALRQQDRLDEAILHFQAALQIKPDSEKAHDNLGIVLLEKGDVDEAITHFQRALQINPRNANAQNNLANALLQRGNMGDAIAHFQQALQIHPDEPAIQNNLAWLLATSSEASLRNGAKAVELARQANALTGGNNLTVLRTLGAACAEAGQFPEALEFAHHAMRLAEAQSNSTLAGQLQSDIKLYQEARPLR